MLSQLVCGLFLLLTFLFILIVFNVVNDSESCTYDGHLYKKEKFLIHQAAKSNESTKNANIDDTNGINSANDSEKG